jgi:hypothetical protein
MRVGGLVVRILFASKCFLCEEEEVQEVLQ